MYFRSSTLCWTKGTLDSFRNTRSKLGWTSTGTAEVLGFSLMPTTSPGAAVRVLTSTSYCGKFLPIHNFFYFLTGLDSPPFQLPFTILFFSLKNKNKMSQVHPSVDSASVTAAILSLRLDEFRYTIFSSSSCKREKKSFRLPCNPRAAAAAGSGNDVFMLIEKRIERGRERLRLRLGFIFDREPMKDPKKNLVSFKISREKEETGLHLGDEMCASWSRREQWRRWEKTCVTKSTIVYVHVYVDSFFFSSCWLV